MPEDVATQENNPTQVTQNNQKPSNVSDWVKKFNASEKVMKEDFLQKYNLARRRLRADYEVKGRNTKKMTHENVNLTYSIGDSFNKSVYFKAPNCNLTAREEVDHQSVENTEIKVNDWLKDKKIKKIVKRCIWDAYLGGFGAIFTDYEYDDIEDPNNILEPGIPAGVDELTGQLTEEVPPVFGRIVLKNEIIAQRIRPDLVRFPKGFDFDNFQDSPWLGFDCIMPIEEVKNQQNWDQNVSSKIEGEKYSTLSDTETKNTAKSDDDELYAKISYVFVKPENKLESYKLIVFCHKYKEAPLQEVEFNKGHVGYPVKFLIFNPLDDDCSYPNGDVWNLESQLTAVETWWRKMVRHVERSNPKTIYDSGAITTKEIANLKQNNDLAFAGVENKGRRPLQDLIYEFQRAPVHPDVSRLYEVARQMISEIAPRSGLSRGAEDEKVDTATEAKIINTGEVIDIEGRIDDVADFIKDIVLDVAGMLETSLQQPIPISVPVRSEVLDPEGNPTGEVEDTDETQVIQVGREGFTSKINIDVDVESMQAQNKDVFRRQLLDFLNFLVKFEPIMNKAGKTIDPIFWLERIMETMNVKNIEKGVVDYIPPIDPTIGIPSAPPNKPTKPPIESGAGQEVLEDAMAGRV